MCVVIRHSQLLCQQLESFSPNLTVTIASSTLWLRFILVFTGSFSSKPTLNEIPDRLRCSLDDKNVLVIDTASCQALNLSPLVDLQKDHSSGMMYSFTHLFHLNPWFIVSFCYCVVVITVFVVSKWNVLPVTITVIKEVSSILCLPSPSHLSPSFKAREVIKSPSWISLIPPFLTLPLQPNR